MDALMRPATLELIKPRTGITTMRSLPVPLRSTRSSNWVGLRNFACNSPPKVLFLRATWATFTSKLRQSTITKATHRQPDRLLLIRGFNLARETPPRQVRR